MTRRQRFEVFGIILLLLAMQAVFHLIGYTLVGAALKALNQQANMLVVQAASAVVGMLMFFAAAAVIGRIVGGRADRTRRMGMFGPILEALTRIAQGDFSVRLDSIIQEDSVIGELAKSVTNLAVELNQMETMRQEFISNVSHEIQSPLTSIRGFARALQNDDLDHDTRQHYLTIIETESTRLSKLADNLLKLTTLEAENLHFEPKTFRLDRQIRDLILLCEPQWSAKSLDLDVSLDDVSITADEDMLSQVWLNLIHNAIKFTPEGGSISAQLHRDHAAAEFRIHDSGIGISAEEQQHVFERFYKADKSRNRAREGSGLGLAIAHKIVTLHHGSITLTSEVNAGTTFTVRLPLTPA